MYNRIIFNQVLNFVEGLSVAISYSFTNFRSFQVYNKRKFLHLFSIFSTRFICPRDFSPSADHIQLSGFPGPIRISPSTAGPIQPSEFIRPCWFLSRLQAPLFPQSPASSHTSLPQEAVLILIVLDIPIQHLGSSFPTVSVKLSNSVSDCLVCS